jgi:hypothetical protein
MARKRPQIRCLLHGTGSKPNICISHPTTSTCKPREAAGKRECIMCAECCRFEAGDGEVFDEEQREGIISETQRRGRLLRNVGVDPERVAGHIRNNNTAPTRIEMDADPKRAPVLEGRHCVYAIPKD